MTGRHSKRSHAARAGASAVLLLAALAGIPGPAAAGAQPVSWASYRLAARRALAEAVAGGARLPADSALRAAAVRFPDGTVLHVFPQTLLAGIAAPRGSALHRAAASALAAIASAPAAPARAGAEAGAAARYRAVLRTPAFAAARPGPLWRLTLALQAVRVLLLGALGIALRTLLRAAERALRVLPPGAARVAGGALGLFAAAAGVWAAVGLLRSGFDRDRRQARRAPPGRAARSAGPTLADAEALLRTGQVSAAVRLAYREAVGAIARRGDIAVRPGWTAHDICRAAGDDGPWPGFAGLGAFHDRVVFGPPAEDGAALAAEAETWLGEVRRWIGDGPVPRPGSQPRSAR